ncbi:MAG: acyltransferase [Rubrivivax sp.]|nr:MAG: acyltransferase [Rubrivivax sp.]
MNGKASQHHPWFDIVRGVSALLVCAGHLRAVLVVDFPGVDHPAQWHPVFYALTGLGHQAVVVFFVLSGFFVGGAVLKPGFEARHYAVARLTRLWVVLIPCLLLTCWLDWITRGLAPSILEGARQAQWHSGPEAGRYDASARTFLGNVLFMQTVAVPVYGSNSPLWSLACEFWYYLLFPLLAVGLGWAAQGATMLSRVGALVAAVALLCWLPGELVRGFAVWLMGLLVWWGTSRSAPACLPLMAKRLMPLTTLLFLGALACSKSAVWQTRLGVDADLLLGAAFALWCLSLAGPGPALTSAWGRWGRWLSDQSYSLYLSHFPLLMFLAALWPDLTQQQPGWSVLFTFAVALMALLAFGWGVWWLFERNTAQVRRWTTQAWAGLWNSIRV